MKFHVMTLFPEQIWTGMMASVVGRALEQKTIYLETLDIRDYTNSRHRRVDDYPYGGGAGLLMQAEPVYEAFQSLKKRNGWEQTPRVVYLTPQGTVFHQQMAQEWAKEEELVFLCGHYEGIDERVLEEIVTDFVSIGDYVLTGGEMPAMIVMDAVARLVPSVLHNEESAECESFGDGLLEHPQYTRPDEWLGRRVPEVLLSGNHAGIETWKREQSLLRTAKRRPDLLGNVQLTKQDRKVLEQMKKDN